MALGRLGQRPHVQLDQVGIRLPPDDLEHLILVGDQHERAGDASPPDPGDSGISHMRGIRRRELEPALCELRP
jgi:hypothetical protein